MASDKKPSIYSERSAIGSSEELDEYGVWVKSEPQDLGSSGAHIPETGVTLDFTIDLGGTEPAADLSIAELPNIPDSDADETTGFEEISFPEDVSSIEIETAELDESPVFEREEGDETSGVSQEVSTEILMKISDELSSIKTELALLKKEVAGFRSGAADHGGFFTEEDDEKIALTGDEMNSFINNNTNFPEPAVVEELPSLEDISFEVAEVDSESAVAAEEEITIDLEDLGIDLDEIEEVADEEAVVDEPEAAEIKIEDYDVFAGAEDTEIAVDDSAIDIKEDIELEEAEPEIEDIGIELEEAAPETLEDIGITLEDTEPEAAEIKIEDYDVFAGVEDTEIAVDDSAIDIKEDIELEEAEPEIEDIGIELEEAAPETLEDIGITLEDTEPDVTLQELDVSLDVDMDIDLPSIDGTEELHIEGVESPTSSPEDTDDREEESTVEAGAAEPDEISFDDSVLDISLDDTAFDLGTEEELDTSAIDLSQAVIEEPDLSVGIIENPVEEPVLEDIAVDENFSIELEEAEELEMLSDTAIEEAEIFLAEEPEEVVEVENTIQLDDSVEPEETVEPEEIENLNLNISLDARDDSLAQIIPEGFEIGAEEAPAPFDDDIEPFVEEELAADTPMEEGIPIEDFTAETVIGDKKTDLKSLDIPMGLKNELRKILSYMDELLESLPEEKIDEFARSEYFDSYKKLFKELGLV